MNTQAPKNQSETSIFGYHPIMEALKEGTYIQKVFIDKEKKGDRIKELTHMLNNNKIHYSLVPKQKLLRLGDKQNSGFVGILSPIKFQSLETLINSEEPQLFIILDQIMDVANMGAIMRTAECVGAAALIIGGEKAALLTEGTAKVSSGALFTLPICKERHIRDAIFMLQQHDVQVLAATEKAMHNIYEVSFEKKSVALVLGSEGVGLQKSVLQSVDMQVKIPVFGNISSLNVSVAAGVMLYEIVRRGLK